MSKPWLVILLFAKIFLFSLVSDCLAQTEQELCYCPADKNLSEAELKRCGDLLYGYGWYAQENHDYQKALSYFNDCLTCRAAAKDNLGEGQTLFAKGKALWWLGRNLEAHGILSRALELQRNGGKPMDIANNLYLLAISERYLGRKSQAVLHYEEALDIAIKADKYVLQIYCKADLADILISQGAYDKAFKLADAALILAKSLNNPKAEFHAELRLTAMYRYAGKNQEALESMQRGLVLARKAGSRPQEGIALMSLGISHSLLGRDGEAMQCLEQGLSIASEVGPRRIEIFILNRMSIIHRRHNRFDLSLGCLEKALAIARQTSEPEMLGLILGELGQTRYELGDLDMAWRDLSEGLRISEQGGYRRGVFWSKVRLARVLAKRGETNAAALAFENALDIHESLREGVSDEDSRKSVMRIYSGVYDELIDLLYLLTKELPGKGFEQKCFEIFERKQGRAFLEAMGRSGAEHFAGIPEDLKFKENKLAESLSLAENALVYQGSDVSEETQSDRRALTSDLVEAKKAFDSFQAELKRNYPDYYELKNPKPVSPQELQQNVLRSGEQMLVYDVTPNHVLLFLLDKNTFILKRLEVSLGELASEINDFRRPIQHMDESEVARKIMLERANSLYEKLIPRELRGYLESSRTIYVIPSGPLYDLPFEALVRRINGAEPEYLIQTQALAYLSSASLLKIIRLAGQDRQSRDRKPYLGFASPVYRSGPEGAAQDSAGLAETRRQLGMGAQIPELPETADEVKAIAETLGVKQLEDALQLREKASRSNVLALNASGELRKYRFLGFACHGLLPGEIDYLNQPALILSQPDPKTKEDGLLTMSDIFGLSLNADMVALTACNSGRGINEKGEGVASMTRAFMFAGAKSVAVTMWPVETRSIKDLSVAFHVNLAHGLSRAEALRQAKLDMLSRQGKRRKNPIYWAPLVLFGDGA